jgi:hypothetical protein
VELQSFDTNDLKHEWVNHDLHPVVKFQTITRCTNMSVFIAEPVFSSNFWAARTMHAAHYNAPPMMTGLLAVYRPALKHTTTLFSSYVQVGCTVVDLMARCSSLSRLRV